MISVGVWLSGYQFAPAPSPAATTPMYFETVKPLAVREDSSTCEALNFTGATFHLSKGKAFGKPLLRSKRSSGRSRRLASLSAAGETQREARLGFWGSWSSAGIRDMKIWDRYAFDTVGNPEDTNRVSGCSEHSKTAAERLISEENEKLGSTRSNIRQEIIWLVLRV